ncbi:MAG TPA: hypothetical protein VH298_04975 [Jatrophihabitans sp.]|jgi:uncharacterized protein involved in tellurium resistance|nr:hypothetical protein [Jatrophihabitans sp.]
MSIADPGSAPPRPDLSYLRHRRRATAPAGSVGSAGGDPVAAVADFLHDRGPHHHSAGTAEPAGNPLELSAPFAPAPSGQPAGNPLDLTEPMPGGNPLDLSTPASTGASLASTGASPAPSGSSLASTGSSSASTGSSVAPTRTVAPATPPARQLAAPRRARPGPPTILSPKEPVVTLTRVQSGVGVLRIEAACSSAVGDLRLGAAYQLSSGTSSVVQLAGGPRTAPPTGHRPVISAERGQFESLTIDLVQSRDLERLIVYAFSDSGAVLNWGGTLLLSTFGQARVELPLDRPPSPRVAVLMSLYNIDGQFVVRAEMEEFAGSVRDAVAGYGFDRIAWLDQRTPLV